MRDLIFLKGLSTNLDSHSLVNGQILFTEDTNELYIDFLSPEDGELIRKPIQDKEVAELLQQHIENLNKVENKSSEDIRNELTYENVINALGYIPSVGEGSSFAAESIIYDNTESGLTGENVQAALDEVVEKNAVNQVKIEYIESELENLSPNSVVNAATGEEIHLTDSAAEGKLAEFSIHGKAKQNTTTGKNLLSYPYKLATQTFNGVIYTVNSDGTVKANGTATAFSYFQLSNQVALESNTDYIISANSTSGKVGFQMRTPDSSISKVSYKEQAALTTGVDNNYYAFVIVNVGDTVNETIYPMIRKASITDNTWEPYTGGIPSPNPEYPQDIEVSGESGSVEVKSVGKNLLPYPYNGYVHTDRGITWIDNKDGTVIANGTATSDAAFYFNENHIFKAGKYILNGCPSGGSNSSYRIQLANSDWTVNYLDIGDGASVTLEENTKLEQFRIFIAKGTTVPNLTFKPMLRLASDTDSTYEPYKSKTATIPTENGLAGIPVDNGGNYTDSNGRQWICDEVVKYADGTGEHIQRVGIIDSYSAEAITGVYMSTTGELTEGAKILYQLAEVIRTPLTQEQLAEIEKLSTFYPVTSISNDFDCGMQVTYFKNSLDGEFISNMYEMQSMTQAAITEVIGDIGSILDEINMVEV